MMQELKWLCIRANSNFFIDKTVSFFAPLNLKNEGDISNLLVLSGQQLKSQSCPTLSSVYHEKQHSIKTYLAFSNLIIKFIYFLTIDKSIIWPVVYHSNF